MNINQKKIYSLLALLSLFISLLTACSIHQVQKSPPLNPKLNWIMLPIANYSDSPDAGDRISDIIATQIRAQYKVNLLESHPPSSSSADAIPELNQQKHLDDVIKWATTQAVQYGLSGSVQEWHYKSGLDAEPAVGITLKVIDLKSEKVIWSASGSKTGWSKASLSGTGHQLIAELLEDLPISE